MDAVTFHVNTNECFGLLGPNGAGKTTLASIVANFSPLTSGEVVVGGVRLSKEANRVKKVRVPLSSAANARPLSWLAIARNLTSNGRT